MLGNEKGITLLEVLLSMAILSIVLLTIVNVFPQMGRMNVYNGEKMKAVNVARSELAEWKKSGSLETPPENYTRYAGSAPDKYHYYEVNKHGFTINVSISKVSDLHTDESVTQTKAHQLLIQVLDDQKIVSETFGYVMVNE